jgi:hypothetical protein
MKCHARARLVSQRRCDSGYCKLGDASVVSLYSLPIGEVDCSIHQRKRTGLGPCRTLSVGSSTRASIRMIWTLYGSGPLKDKRRAMRTSSNWMLPNRTLCDFNRSSVVHQRGFPFGLRYVNERQLQTNSSRREAAYLAGRLIKWYKLYREAPAPLSWVWWSLPDGTLWLKGNHDYGMDAVNKMTSKYVIDDPVAFLQCYLDDRQLPRCEPSGHDSNLEGPAHLHMHRRAFTVKQLHAASIL